MKNGDLRIWWFTNNPSEPFYHSVIDGYDGRAVLEFLSKYNSHLTELVHSNKGGMQVYENGEWVEWEDEEGNPILKP